VPGSSRAAHGILLIALAAGWGCGEPAPRLLRLVEVADRDAIVDSPLLDLEAVGELATTVVWSSDFEGDLKQELGWPVRQEGPGVTVRREGEHGQVACFRGVQWRMAPVLLAVTPLARYRVTRLLKTTSGALDLKVVESSVDLKRPGEVNNVVDRRRLASGRILAKGATPAVHRFHSAPAGEWQRQSVDLTTGIDTRSLAIVFEPPADAAQARAAEACLAELRVERIATTPRQELALLRTAASARDALGLVRRGLLLPVPRLKVARPPYDGNYEVRDALFAPAPTRLRFDVRVPEGGRFTFGYALARESQVGDAVDFEVAVRDGGSESVVFGERAAVGRKGAGWHWRDAEVDLAPWAGRTVALELTTRSSSPRGFALWGNPTIDAPRRAGDPPNVLVVGIDTLRADRLSSYGYDRPTSPNLDRLAAEGVRFDQAVSASNWTAPSFASIFTGLAPTRHQVVTEDYAMSGSIETLAERLRDGGWRTHAVVYKAYLFGLGLDQGFDRWFNLPTSNRTAQVNLDKALAWLEDNHDRRFFLFLHLDDPHQPFNQPPPFDLRFGDPQVHAELGIRLPIAVRYSQINGCPGCMDGRRAKPEFVRAAQALYDGAVAYTDDRIGALFGRLREWGVWDDTVVAVVADHGEVIYDRPNLWGHGALLLTDELVRVPLILKPARGWAFEAGTTVRAQVRTTDLEPTLLEAVGLPPGPPSEDSRSLWPLVAGPETSDRVAFMENPARGVVGVRTPEWKYVVATWANGPGRAMLYDLRHDPGELRNVLAERPEEGERLAERLARFIVRTRPGPFLLAVGDGQPGAYNLRLETPDGGGYSGYVGLPPAVSPGPDVAVRAASKLLALVQVDLVPPRRVRAALTSRERTLATATGAAAAIEPYASGVIERLLQRPGPALYFVAGAPPIDGERVTATTTEDQLDDLRDLGYID
jgi:arylsulfatase A-like enzyme